MKKLLAIVFVLLLISSSTEGTNAVMHYAQKPIKILAIGNSFTQNALLYLPEISKSKDLNIEIATAILGGASLEKHVTLIDQCEKDSTLKPYHDKFSLKELLVKDEYDYVTIQQVSHASYKCDSYEPYAEKLIQFIKEYAPSAKILIHQTWAYSPSSKKLKEWNVERAFMHEQLVECYNGLSKRYAAGILPSGEAFYSAYDKRSDIGLWKDDGYHANENGCFLAGCVWFGELFKKDPRNMNYVPLGMDSSTANFLKDVAAKQTSFN